MLRCLANSLTSAEYSRTGMGLRTLPWGTPYIRVDVFDSWPLKTAVCIWLPRNDFINIPRIPKKVNGWSLRISWSTVWDVAERSRRPRRVILTMIWSAARRASETILRTAVTVDLPCRYADWRESKCVWWDVKPCSINQLEVFHSQMTSLPVT